MSFRQALILIVFISALITLPFLGNDFSTKGEPREALSAQYIYETGNWILPFRYGDEFATKPPILHWLITLTSIANQGVNEFSARFPSALLSIIGITVFFVFLSKYCGVSLALLSSIICLSNIEWYRTAVSARVDMALSVFLLIAFISFYTAYASNFKKRAFSILCILSLSLASLAKGPVAIALPGLVFFIFLLKEKYRFIPTIKTLFPFILVPCLILGSWYLAAYQIGGDKFLEVVLNENFRRLTGDMQEELGGAHEHSAFYLYATLLSGFLPWTFLLFSPIWKYVRWQELRFPKALLQNFKLSSLDFYFGLIAFIFIAFFSIPESKRSVYLLPAYPFISYFLAIYCRKLAQHFPQYCRRFTIFAASLIFFIIGTCLILISNTDLSGYLNTLFPNLEYFLEEIRTVIQSQAILHFCLSALVIFLCIYSLQKQKIISLIALWICTICFIDFAILTGLSAALSAKPLANEIYNMGIPINDTRSFNRDYGLNFYLQGNLKEFDKSDCSSAKTSYLLIKSNDLNEAREKLQNCLKMERIHTTSRLVERTSNKYMILRLN